MRVFPHLMGSPVNTCAFAQLDAAIPNYYIQEANLPHGAAREIVDQPPQVVDGYLQLPDRPGIGIEIDESAAARFPFHPRRPPAPPQPRCLHPPLTPRLVDGSIQDRWSLRKVADGVVLRYSRKR